MNHLYPSFKPDLRPLYPILEGKNEQVALFFVWFLRFNPNGAVTVNLF